MFGRPDRRARDDFGKSLANRREISELMGVRLGNTLFLAGSIAVDSSGNV